MDSQMGSGAAHDHKVVKESLQGLIIAGVVDMVMEEQVLQPSE